MAQDQLKGQLELIATDPQIAPQIRPGVYDGDTPTAQRRRIKAEANLILSNPDMLHASILPYHPKWSRFFSDLKFIVLDEVHTYRGILGAHVACVLRRLLRVCEHYGSQPIFLGASATIANPGELTSRLVGRSVEVIDTDGSPRGRKFFVLWNPLCHHADSLARSSATDDAVWLMTHAMESGAQTLTFTRTRQATELVNRYVQHALAERRSPLARQMPRIAAAICRTNVVRSSRICSQADCAAWRPPTRWNWVSTSDRSMSRCSSITPEPSPAPGSKQAVADVATVKA